MYFGITIKDGPRDLTSVMGRADVDIPVSELEQVITTEHFLEKILGYRVHINQVTKTGIKLALLFALLFAPVSQAKHTPKPKPQQPYTMFAFDRPAPDCYLVSPARHSKGVATWECATKPVGHK